MERISTEEKLFCTGCQVAGDKSGRGNGVHLRSCDKCGFPFCTHCGKEDRFSSQFMCNNCWKETADNLVMKGRLNDAIIVLERLGDFDSIKDIVKMREGTSFRGKERKIIVRRKIMVEDGRLVIGTEFQGRSLSDILISRMSKTSLVQEVGWELAPIFKHIYEVFSRTEVVTGDFLLDLENNKVSYKEGTGTMTAMRYVLFERMLVYSPGGKVFATRMEGEIIIDSAFKVIPKRMLVKELGWEKVSLLLKIMRNARTSGVFVLDIKTGKIGPIENR